MYHEVPIGQYVGDFCSVPRGCVRGKRKNRSRTYRALYRESSPCATRWREGKKKNKRKIKDSVGDRLSNNSGISFFSLCPVRWRKKENTMVA